VEEAIDFCELPY
jgi:hypothetical protein